MCLGMLVGKAWTALMTCIIIPICARYLYWVGGLATAAVNLVVGLVLPGFIPTDPTPPDEAVVSAEVWADLTTESRCAVVKVIDRIAVVMSEAGLTNGSAKYTVQVHRVMSGYDDRPGSTAPLLIFEVKPISTAINYDASPVICQHGVLDTCGAFMFQKSGSLLTKLIRERRCVYLTNSRFSRVCESPSSVGAGTGCSTFGHMAIFDVPANINFVRKRTKATRVTWVGHSQGTAQMFAALSLGYEDVGVHDALTRDVYDDLQKALACVERFIALAPVTRLAHFVGHRPSVFSTLSPWMGESRFWPDADRGFHVCTFFKKLVITGVYFVLRLVLLAVAGLHTARFLRALGFGALLTGGMKPLLPIGTLVMQCAPQLLLPIASVLTGWNPDSGISNEDISDSIGGTTPGGATTLDFSQWSHCVGAHWSEITERGRRDRVGGFFQPKSSREYTLRNILYQHADHLKVVALFYGSYDRLGNPRDVADLRADLDAGLRDAVKAGRAPANTDPAHVVRTIPLNYSHLDFVWSRDACREGGLNDQVVALV